jgi:hypothetical protein
MAEVINNWAQTNIVVLKGNSVYEYSNGNMSMYKVKTNIFKTYGYMPFWSNGGCLSYGSKTLTNPYVTDVVPIGDKYIKIMNNFIDGIGETDMVHFMCDGIIYKQGDKTTLNKLGHRLILGIKPKTLVCTKNHIVFTDEGYTNVLIEDRVFALSTEEKMIGCTERYIYVFQHIDESLVFEKYVISGDSIPEIVSKWRSVSKRGNVQKIMFGSKWILFQFSGGVYIKWEDPNKKPKFLSGYSIPHVSKPHNLTPTQTYIALIAYAKIAKIPKLVYMKILYLV